MSKVETPDEWTEIQVVSVDYEVELKRQPVYTV